MSAEQVAIVAVTYYSTDVVGQFLDSVAGSAAVTPRVVLVDNTPEPDGLDAIAADHPTATVIHAEGNLGFGGGINRGVAALPPEIRWLVLSNPDLVMQPGAIDELIAAAERLPDGGSFGPMIRSGDGTVYPSGRKLPSLRTGVGHALFVRVWPTNPWTTSYRNDLAAIDEHAVGWLSGAFLLVRRDAFEAVGGFDSRYFMYFEDVDLGRNLGIAGYKNYYVPSAQVVHYGAMSTSKSPRAMIRAHHESAYRYLAKRYRGWYLWPVRVTLRVGLGVRSRFAKG